MRSRRTVSRQRGLSLVELMIALTLGLMLTAAIGYFYLGSRQSYRTQDGMARLQENARYALEVIARDVRMAGYRGCVGPTVPITNTLNNPNQYPWNFAVPIQGFEATSATVWSPALDASITSPLGGRDVLTVRGAFGGGTLVTAHAASTAPLTVNAGSGLQQGNIVLVADCTDAAVFQITNSSVTTSVEHAAGAGTPGNASADLGKVYTGGELIQVSTKTYYVRANPAGRPALYRIEGSNAAQELVENVADMQIDYGVDTSGNFAVNSYLTANNVTDWNQVLSVRVNLLVSSEEDNIVPQPQQFLFDGATVTAPDRRLYKVFSTTIGLRNRLP